MQACFLGDMRVIWYNSLGDSLFQIYVMNNVEIMIDYYLFITSHVSHAITSCIHKLFFTKLSTWYCVWISFCHPRLNVPWFWCKICLMFEFLGTKRLKNLFLEDLGWIHVFLKNYSSHTHAFLLKFSNLRFFGFLIFKLFSFTFDHWDFVTRWYSHDSHTLIWLNLWFGKILKF